MAITWIVMTNGCVAKVLELKKHGGEISEVKSFSHLRNEMTELDDPEYQKKAADSRHLHHAVDYSRDVDAHERKVFAKEIAGFLEEALIQSRYNKLVLVASQKMLGELRQELPNTVKKLVEHDLDKDLLTVALSNEKIIEKILADLGILHF